MATRPTPIDLSVPAGVMRPTGGPGLRLGVFRGLGHQDGPDVATGSADDGVVAAPADDPVGARAALQPVVVVAAVDVVGAGARVDDVVAVVAGHLVVSEAGVEGVVAEAAGDHVVAVTGGDGVVVRAARRGDGCGERGGDRVLVVVEGLTLEELQDVDRVAAVVPGTPRLRAMPRSGSP